MSRYSHHVGRIWVIPGYGFYRVQTKDKGDAQWYLFIGHFPWFRHAWWFSQIQFDISKCFYKMTSPCGTMPEIKVQYSMLPWYLGKSGGPQVKQPSLAANGWGTVPIYPWEQVSVPCQLTELFQQANLILPREAGDASLSWYCEAYVPIAPGFHSVPEHNPSVACGACGVLPASGLGIYVTSKVLWSPASSIGCWVLATAVALGQESFYPLGG